MNVTGMTCNHCVETVRRALMENANVRLVDVNLKTGTVTVRGDNIDAESLGKTVAGLGYTVEGLGGADV
ncbi:MAG: heavy-metal-associated domain-containing protein [Candidatus Hydrogenedentes bacterium]|nr:heavy-metal-associated domain-containing protein [Candidatus Hydrogenedentota bacterium]